MTSRLHISRIILVVSFILTISFVKAQDLDRKISVSLKDVTLKEALDRIGGEAGIYFSYSPQMIPVAKKVSLQVRSKPVSIVLDELLKPLDIRYFISENQVILRPVDRNNEIPDQSLRKRKFTLNGFVRDKATGEVLIGVNIFDRKSLQGTTSNGYGFYSLTLPEGIYTLTVSLLGYEKQEITVRLKEDTRNDLLLSESLIPISMVEVKAVPKESNPQESDPGTFRFSGSMMKSMTGFAGNFDMIKSLQTVPGISTFGDGSGFLYVRGGNSDQNLLIIDDAPIYNASHLFGFFSALAPDAIKDVRTYKGDFPASYGGRLSSVIDVRARDGNLNRLGFSGNTGLFTTDLTIEGPLKKERSSFILSGRRSNMNWLNFSSRADRSFSILFYDLNAKLNLRINNNNRLFLTGFAGNDDFSRYSGTSVNTFGIQWKNAAGTFRWNHIFNSRLFSNTTASFSRYDYFLFISRELDNYWTSSISNGTLKSDFSWFLSPSVTLRTGAEVSRHFSNPGNIRYADDGTGSPAPVIPQYHSLGYALYFDCEQEVNQRLSLRYGLRMSAWQDLGPTTVYLFDATHKVIDTADVDTRTVFRSFLNPEPRLSISYTLSDYSAVKAGYTRTVQYLQMLSNSTSPFTSLEVWAPAGMTLQPQKADQFSLGYVRSSDGQRFVFSAEGYYKIAANQVEYKDHANMLYNPLLEGELRFGETHSYGIELLLRKMEGKVTGWIGYAWTKALRKAEDVNGGNEYPASFDRPNTVSLSISYRPGRRWEYSANWIYLSGSPVTTPTGFYQYNGYIVPLFGAKNNDRLPAYHRMDVAVTCWLNRPESRYRHSLVLSVYNLYGRENPFEINFNKIMGDDGKFYVPSDLNGNYEIVPTQLSIARAIPSLNYVFRF